MGTITSRIIRAEGKVDCKLLPSPLHSPSKRMKKRADGNLTVLLDVVWVSAETRRRASRSNSFAPSRTRDGPRVDR
jgi:hypothetical protein